MQLLRDVQKSVARGELLLANPDAPQMLRELGPGERGGRRVQWIGVQCHGRLEEVEAVLEHETVLDLAVLERLEGSAPAEHRDTRLRGFAQQWETALMLRQHALAQAGLIIEAESDDVRRGRAAPGALEQVRARMHQRDRTPLSFAEVEQQLGKPGPRALTGNVS